MRYNKTSNKSNFSIMNRLSTVVCIVVCRFLEVNAMGKSHDKRHHLDNRYSVFTMFIQLNLKLVSVVGTMPFIVHVESKAIDRPMSVNFQIYRYFFG